MFKRNVFFIALLIALMLVSGSSVLAAGPQGVPAKQGKITEDVAAPQGVPAKQEKVKENIAEQGKAKENAAQQSKVQENIVDNVARLPVVSGKVSAVELALPDGTITVEAANGFKPIVRINAETRLVIEGVAAPTWEQVQVGDKIEATGKWINRTEMQAVLVMIRRPETRPVQLLGVVKDKVESAFTLVTREGDKAITVNEDTKYFVPGVASPTFADVVNGDQALVMAQPGAEGLLTALTVTIRRPQPVPVELAGKIKSIAPATAESTSPMLGSFVLETRQGDKTIQVNESTRFAITGMDNPTFADVKVGDQAQVTALASPIRP